MASRKSRQGNCSNSVNPAPLGKFRAKFSDLFQQRRPLFQQRRPLRSRSGVVIEYKYTVSMLSMLSTGGQSSNGSPGQMKRPERILFLLFGSLAAYGVVVQQARPQGFGEGPRRGERPESRADDGRDGDRDYRSYRGYRRYRGESREDPGPPDGGRSSDDRPGDSSFRGRGGPRFGPPGMGQDDRGRASRYRRFLERMDTNHDGRIEPNEADGPMRFMYQGMAERAGLDASKPISLDEFREAMARRAEHRGSDRDDGDSSESNRSNTPEQDPLVPGFERVQSLPPVPGFGVRVAGGAAGGQNSSSDNASSDASASASEKSRTEFKVRAYAKGVVKKYDRDGNGTLEKDEWSRMRNDPQPADRNNDGVITEQELAVRFLQDRLGGSSGNLAGSGGFGPRESYRTPTALERLPDEIPDWFIDKDADGDGQVAMHEYAGFWSDSTAREFAGFDANNDGVITPQECLGAGSRPSESASTPVGGSPVPARPDAEPDSVAAGQPETKEESSGGGGGFWWTR